MKRIFVIAAALVSVVASFDADALVTGNQDTDCGQHWINGKFIPSCKFTTTIGGTPQNVSGAYQLGFKYSFRGVSLNPYSGPAGLVNNVYYFNPEFIEDVINLTPVNGKYELSAGLGCNDEAIWFVQRGVSTHRKIGFGLQEAGGTRDRDIGKAVAGTGPCGPEVDTRTEPDPEAADPDQEIWDEIIDSVFGSEQTKILIIDGEYPEAGDNPGTWTNIYKDFGSGTCDQNAVKTSLMADFGLTAASNRSNAPNQSTYLDWMESSGLSLFHTYGAVYRCVEAGDVVYRLYKFVFSDVDGDADGIDDESVEVEEVHRHDVPAPSAPTEAILFGTIGNCAQYQTVPVGTKRHSTDVFEVEQLFTGGSWVHADTHESNPSWPARAPTGGSAELRVRLVGIGGVSAWFNPGPGNCPCMEESDDDHEYEEE